MKKSRKHRHSGKFRISKHMKDKSNEIPDSSETSEEIRLKRTNEQILSEIQEKIRKKEDIDRYIVNANEVKIQVNIVKIDEGVFYSIKLPELSEPTKALLNNLRQKLINSTEINFEVTDRNAIEKLKTRLRLKSEDLLKQQFKLSEDTTNLLSGILINEMVGLGNIELLIADPNLEEIVVTSAKEPVRVFHKKYGWLITNLRLETEKQIENYSAIIARRVGRQITTLTPMLDAHLITGDRVNSILYPICTKGNTITIRKFAREPWTAVDFINNGTCTLDIFALI